LDRQSIEKRDFPVGRRGYDPDAVDAHLNALADEVAELRRSTRTRSRGDTLASSASDQVRAIVEAAETSAADIRREAESEAREIRDEADAEARTTREQATERARAHVRGVSESADSMLTRLNSMQTELDALLGALRAGAGRLSTELQSLQGELGEIRDVAGPHRTYSSETFDEPAGYEDEPIDEVFAEPDPEPPAAPVAAATPEFDEDAEGARLVALNMALDGTPREETARYLQEAFGLADSGELLDDVYASAEG
jgi:DivIVA domain-containing protein